MTTPRDDIAGLIEEINARHLHPVYPHHLGELLDEAATQLDALKARVKELEEDVTEIPQLLRRAEARAAALSARVKDYEEVLADKRRLAREIDVALCGEEGAAKQASLCDLVEPARRLRARVKELEAERDAYNVEIGIWKVQHDRQLEAAESRALRAEQERDEAYITAASEAESQCYGSTGHAIGKRIRQLASGPEK